MLPQSGSLEQILRAMKQLAQSPAFMLELEAVAADMGDHTFRPAPMVDAAGEAFDLEMEDTSYDGKMGWVSYPGPFQQVLTVQGLRPVPPYPMLQLLGAEGVVIPGTQADQSSLAIWEYVIDAVTVVVDDDPNAATRRAMAYSDAFDRLLKRNEHLGGLVYLIFADGTPVPGGEVEQSGSGVVSGIMQRYHARALRSIPIPTG